MAPAAGERRAALFEGPGLNEIAARLAPFPGRLEFAVRLALICALTTLVVAFYQTPEPALTAYVAFILMKPDRAASVVTSVVMLLLISLIIGLVLALTVEVIDQPLWRVTAMTLVSFCLTFAASASKLKPVAGTVALITAYALDLLGTVPGGELATRGILYVWLFVGIPTGVSIVVNLVLGPSPRRLAERALAHRLRCAAAVLVAPETRGKATGAKATGAKATGAKATGVDRREGDRHTGDRRAEGVRGVPARGARRSPGLAQACRRRANIARAGHRGPWAGGAIDHRDPVGGQFPHERGRDFAASRHSPAYRRDPRWHGRHPRRGRLSGGNHPREP
jgi:hypothetical protein